MPAAQIGANAIRLRKNVQQAATPAASAQFAPARQCALCASPFNKI